MPKGLLGRIISSYGYTSLFDEQRYSELPELEVCLWLDKVRIRNPVSIKRRPVLLKLIFLYNEIA